MEHAKAGFGLKDLESRETPDYTTNPLTMQNGKGIETISFCASPADAPSSAKIKRPRPEVHESLGGMLRRALMQHQLGITLNLLFLLTLTYSCFPSLRSHLQPVFTLQYEIAPGQYYQGPQDVWIVLGFAILFTGFRAGCLDYVLMPLAKLCGIRKTKMQIRFAEQAYLLLYYIVIWTWGLRLFIADTPVSQSTTILGQVNDLLVSLWRDFPRLTMNASMKAYYLSQSAFWIQQILVIHLEERRKDHWQMLAHHFITVGLLVFSYGYRQMRAGNAILVLMDVVDLVFPLAKCLRYIGLQTACDIAFGVFVVTWCLARHVAYMGIVYSIVFHVGTDIMHYGTYSTTNSAKLSSEAGTNVLGNLLQPLLNPEASSVQFNARTRGVFIALLGGLQLITIAWFVMICRVVARVVRGEGADDTRSDDEGDDDVEDGTAVRPSLSKRGSEQKFIEVSADADDLYYQPQRAGARMGMTRKKSKGMSSGLNLGEHKDILNRIGCLSDEQLAREAERRQQSGSPQPGSTKR